MALSDFFSINFPYGLKRNSKGEWFVFNREYMPLGWNSLKEKKSIFDDKVYSHYPIYTKYKGLTDVKLKKLAHIEDSIRFDEKGKINQIFFYDSRTNPNINPENWTLYLEKMKILSSLKVKHE
ncbi:MAG: hypothetical protein ACPGVB_10440 [Chitinophagales bacterium]